MSRAPQPGDLDRFLLHQDALRRLARALDSHAADDLMQDTWLHTLRRPPAEGIPVGPWLRGVLRNVWRMRRRADARRTRREELADVHGAGFERPDSALECHRDFDRLERLVAELPPASRVLIEQRYFQGLSAAEIARLEGLPSGTVRRRLKHALDQMRAERKPTAGVAMVVGLREVHAKPAFGSLAEVLAMKASTKLALGAVAVAAVAFGGVAASGGIASDSLGLGRPSSEPAPESPARSPAVGRVVESRPPQIQPSSDSVERSVTEARRAARRRRDDVLLAIRAALEKRRSVPDHPGPTLEDGELAPDYILERITEDLIPEARGCYNQILLEEPDYQGTILVDFTLVADENLGGVVEEVDLVEGTDIDNEQMRECLRDAMYGLVFDPPDDGGSVRVTYPIAFEPG